MELTSEFKHHYGNPQQDDIKVCLVILPQLIYEDTFTAYQGCTSFNFLASLNPVNLTVIINILALTETMNKSFTIPGNVHTGDMNNSLDDKWNF